jgi:hypothetical protein
MITKKHDDIAAAFMDRMSRDQCSPTLTWNYNDAGDSIVSITLTSSIRPPGQQPQANRCNVKIPVTVPKSIQGKPRDATLEQLGNDPLTIWVKMNGQPVTITLSEPVRL